ncbi:3-deoxy-manno-octulosonate cytidylyltransferase [Bacteroides sp. CG01]|uniref:3-deoxy-manno-octulosonate cytidylyltransferase n=1 Tax=Bacteroides TaxID=816 RepID=UPI002AFE1B83|nr:3-deoxy-manno-octulosonate cytidylyltransferase [Bacteroides sp. CG01]
MKTVAIIPARYNSSRFPGKPLVDICGKPMIWWVYNQVKQASRITEVMVATDDKRILEACSAYAINCVMTRSDHSTSTERLYEVAQNLEADLYVCINGDEPLIDPELVNAIVPLGIPQKSFFVSNLMTEIKNPAEVVDFTNIKVVTDTDSNALFMSRGIIPYPKSSIEYKYYKHVGVLVYTLEALKFFSETSKGYNEKIEDINELRFIEHGKKIKMVEVQANSLSVDTPKDLDKVVSIIRESLKHE